MQVKRRRRRLAAALLSPIWLGYSYLTIGRTGSVAAFFADPWLLVAVPGWLSIVVLSLVNNIGIPSEAVVLNPVTGQIDDDGHRLTVY